MVIVVPPQTTVVLVANLDLVAQMDALLVNVNRNMDIVELAQLIVTHNVLLANHLLVEVFPKPALLLLFASQSCVRSL